LQHNNIIINEGGLPECARERAIEHQRQRTKALVLCERSKPVTFQPCAPGCDAAPGFLGMPHGVAPALPSLDLGTPPAPKDFPEGVPPPKENKDVKPASATTMYKDLPASLGAVVPASTPRTLPSPLPTRKLDMLAPDSDPGVPPVPKPLTSLDGSSEKP